MNGTMERAAVLGSGIYHPSAVRWKLSKMSREGRGSAIRVRICSVIIRVKAVGDAVSRLSQGTIDLSEANEE